MEYEPKLEQEGKEECVTKADMGQMFLLFDKALVCRSSTSIVFFKKDPETDRWEEYHRIKDLRGTIFFTKGNIRIQITTEKRVHFYIIDKETLEPKLENVMYNFTNCSSLLIGTKVRFGIAFKTSQPDFEIFTRRQYHNFKVCIDTHCFEGAVGCGLEQFGCYAMAENLKIAIYD